jgi:DNA-binding NtrC family response regulator
VVVLLDDNGDFRSALAANLADDGFAVREYGKPADVPLGSLPAPQVLILDYQMPGENGLAFADRFHAAHPGVPVVMITAYWSDYLDAQVTARDFLTLRRKPIDYDQLLALLPPA